MSFFRKRPKQADMDKDVEHELRLNEAENRANNVYEKAMELRTMVVRRDQANHWQESVNRLYQGRA